MGDVLRIDRHELRREHDVLLARLDGVFDLKLAVPLHDLLARIAAETGRCYVIADVTALGSMTLETRRYASEWHKTHTIDGAAAYGASFATRVLVTLMTNAVRLVTGRGFVITHVHDEAEARAWVAARRPRP